MVLAFIICVVKISLLVSRKVDPDHVNNPDDKAWYGQFGFRFESDQDDLDYKLNGFKTFLPEVIMFVLSLLNCAFLKITQ